MKASRIIGAALVAMMALGMPASAADRALLVGVDRYQDPKLDLNKGSPARDDITNIATLLKTRLSYDAAAIKILTDQEATRDAILKTFREWLIEGSTEGSRVYFYYAGQGYFIKDTSGDEVDGLDEGIVPFDATTAPSSGTDLVINGLILDDELSALLGELKGRSVTLVMESDFSGRVTRDAKLAATQAGGAARVVATRAIAIEPRAALQKSEGGFLDPVSPDIKYQLWSAVSASQSSLADQSGDKRTGAVFTRLYLEGALDGKADSNGNGTISNAELLAYITEGSKKLCEAQKDACEMGLTPRLEPAAALAGTFLAKPGSKPGELKIDVGTLTDFLGKGNTAGITLGMVPEGPIKVGQRDIRFRVTSPHDGFLLLLNLTDAGDLIVLYPNQFSRKNDAEGRILANRPLTVPDDYYGISFDADTASSGQIIAVVTRNRVEFAQAVGTRAIEIIPRQQATDQVLPKLAELLGKPELNADASANTAAIAYSVATMRYEIGP